MDMDIHIHMHIYIYMMKYADPTMTRFSLRTILKVWRSSLRSLTDRAGGVMLRSRFIVWLNRGSV